MQMNFPRLSLGNETKISDMTGKFSRNAKKRSGDQKFDFSEGDNFFVKNK